MVEPRKRYRIDGSDYAFANRAFRFLMSRESGREARKRALASELSVSPHTVKSWYCGDYAPCCLELVDGIARFLGVDREELLVSCEEGQRGELLGDRQKEAFCRVYAELMRFFELADVADGFVWPEYCLDAFPASLVEDIVPTLRWTVGCETSLTLLYGERGILAADLHQQLYERAVRRLGMERPWLGNGSAYAELEAFIEDYVFGYAYEVGDDGIEHWAPNPDAIYDREPVQVDGDSASRPRGRSSRLLRQRRRWSA